MNTITNERPADLPATQGNIIAQANAVAQGKSSASLEGLQHVMHISMATYVASLTSSIMSYKHATLLEAATGLAIMCERNAADRHARRMLVSVYAAAGYDCADSSTGGEYKSVMRKVAIISELFNFIGAEKVQEWVGGNSEGAAIAAIVKGLEPFGIRSMDGILSLVGKPRMPRAISAPTAPAQIETKQPQAPAETAPEAAQAAKVSEVMEEGEIKLPEAISTGEQPAEPSEEMPKFARRSTDVSSKQAAANTHSFILGEGDYVEIGTEHVSIRLSHDADKSEILKAALQLMEIADEMEAKQMQEKADSDSALAIKLMEEMRKMTTGKKAPSATEGGLEPMKPVKGRRLVR